MIKAIVTDIEGTTSDIRFVHNVLFPYARVRLAGALASADEQPEIAQTIALLRDEIAQPQADTPTLLQALYDFMDQDRKSTALKRLQGIIWRTGYLNGDFRGHVYADVASQLRVWHAQGIALYVYSSGSVEAQQLLFGYSDAGDLRPLFSDYFDTRVGGKREAASYQRIAQTIGLPAEQLLFLSDIHQELDAAAEAGWQTRQLIRGAEDGESRHHQVTRFDVIDPSLADSAD